MATEGRIVCPARGDVPVRVREKRNRWTPTREPGTVVEAWLAGRGPQHLTITGIYSRCDKWTYYSVTPFAAPDHEAA